jgi:hypothetical protein
VIRIIAPSMTKPIIQSRFPCDLTSWTYQHYNALQRVRLWWSGDIIGCDQEPVAEGQL